MRDFKAFKAEWGKTTSESSNVPEVSSNIPSEPKTEDASESKPEGGSDRRKAGT